MLAEVVGLKATNIVPDGICFSHAQFYFMM